jgi:nucleotide-binding universal stress UspA family protein
MTQAPHQRPVVVGVDASDESLRAVRFAADEAHLRAAPLRIVHALAARFRGAHVRPGDLDVPGLLHSGAEGVLQWAAEAVADRVAARTVSTSVLHGDPVGVLRAESANAQLLVVGSRGVGGVTGLLLGSTASGLAGQTDCPLVVLPDDTTAWVRDRVSVVVGVEGRAADDDVLEFAFAEAAARGTDLVAVHAWQDVALETAFQSLGPLVDWAGVQGDEKRVLSEALAGWTDKQPDVAVREVVVRERTAQALVGASLTAQLLVVGHHRRRAVGSTTHAALHRATCPVAVVPISSRTSR